MFAATNLADAYSEVGIETGVIAADPHKLILMLFEGALLAVADAKTYMLRQDMAAKGEAISKAIAIIEEGLKASLDVEAGGGIAKNLSMLYDFMVTKLLLANLKNQLASLDDVSRLLTELNSAWTEIRDRTAMATNEVPPNPSPLRVAVSYGKA